MNLAKQTVYLPVRVEGELPEIKTNTGLFVMSNIHGWDKLVAYKQMFVPKEGYYLCPQEAFVFTPEQLNQYTANVIKQTLETAAEKAYVEYIDLETSEIFDYTDVITDDGVGADVCKQSITNTFEETFKRFKHE